MGFRGVLIVASGRFTRAERATFRRRRRGRLSTSTLDFPVEYYLSQVALKYGACGLKVVVCRFSKFNHFFWRLGDEKI
jgi:ribosomal protein S3